MSEKVEEENKQETVEEKALRIENEQKVAERLKKIEEISSEEKFLNKKDFDEDYDWENKEQIGNHSADGVKFVVKIKSKKDGQYYVAKVWQKILDLETSDILAIVNLKKNYYHSNIVQYKALYSWEEDMSDSKQNEDKKLDTLIVATMEYFPTTLQNLMEKNGQGANDIEVAYLLQKGLSVIQYLQEQNKTSMFNIKPANIFISQQGDYVFSDFGQCQINDSAQSQKEAELKRTPASIYLSPEFYNAVKMQSDKKLMNFEKVDIYALGIILLEFTNGKLPQSESFLTNKQIKQDLGKSSKFIQKIIMCMTNEKMEMRLKGKEVSVECCKLAKVEAKK